MLQQEIICYIYFQLSYYAIHLLCYGGGSRTHTQLSQ